MFKKILLGLLGLATAAMVSVLLFGQLMADKLSRPETIKQIMAADEPCREAFTKVLDLQEKRDANASKVSSEGEPVCRKAYDKLRKINIFVPQKDFTDERLKRDTIKSCALLSRARADLMVQYGSARPDDTKLATLNSELADAEKACQNQFKQLATRL